MGDAFGLEPVDDRVEALLGGGPFARLGVAGHPLADQVPLAAARRAVGPPDVLKVVFVDWVERLAACAADRLQHLTLP